MKGERLMRINWKSFGFGLLCAFALMITVSASFAAIVGSGQGVVGQAGKNLFYVFIPSEYNDEVRDAAAYWDGMNETKTATQGYVDLNAQGVSCLREWIVVGHNLYDQEVYRRTRVSINPVE
jgi:hypothetical protein